MPWFKHFFFWEPVKYLELAITDFCNLNCRLCAQGIPLQKDKKEMTFDELERISKIFKPYEFDVVKISGGEPTLHSQFQKICENIKELFPAYFYKLATNGCLLEKYIDNIRIFDHIDLSNYPGKNDESFFHIINLNIPNLYPSEKADYHKMIDIFQEKNLGKNNIFGFCTNSNVKKIIQSRIYPCCNIFGLSLHRKISRNKISAFVDKNWRVNLGKINIEPYCEHCWTNVATTDHVSITQRFGREIKRNIFGRISLYKKNI